MDEEKRQLRGSPSRDAFKRWHKELPGGFYATDVDFALVSKNPPGVIAMIEYKRPDEDILFSQVLLYNNELKNGTPVYIVSGRMMPDGEMGPFKIYRYLGGDWRPEPPDVEKELVFEGLHGADFERWESSLRAKYRSG